MAYEHGLGMNVRVTGGSTGWGVDGDKVCEAKVKVKAAGLPRGGGGQGVEEGKLAKAHQVTLGPWHHATGVMLVLIK
jgi:hypothetical protein